MADGFDTYSIATDTSLLGVAGPIDPGAGTVYAPTSPDVPPPVTTDTPGITAVNLPGAGYTIYNAPIGPTIPAYATVSAGAVAGGANTTIPAPTAPPVPGVTSGYGGILDQFLRSTQVSGARAVGAAWNQAGTVLVTSIPGLSVGRNIRPASFTTGLGGGMGAVFAVAIVGVIVYAALRK